MLIKDCVLKHSQSDIWLHHTASGYKVRINAETLAVLESMLARRAPGEMSEKEKFIYEKLAVNGIAGEDTGRAEDRRIPVKKKSFLDSVELEFSGRCNLSCAHCFSALSQKDMDRATLDKVFEGIDALEPVNILINGGEPLLNPLLPEALEKARARHMRVGVMTNATLAGAGTAALFGKCGVAKAVVSLDFFEETHDAMRGAGTFKKAVNGIKLFVSQKVPVFITAMVQEKTAGLLDDFKNFCLGELGASGVRFSSIIPIGRAACAGAVTGGDAQQTAKTKEGLGLSAEGLKNLFNKGLLSEKDENEDIFTRLAGSRYFHCNAGAGQCFVSADGKVYACHYFQNIGSAMGDLSVKPLEQIYRDYLESGAIATDFDWSKLGKCKACAHFAKCRGGCRARAKILAGGWYEPDAFSCGMYGI